MDILEASVVDGYIIAMDTENKLIVKFCAGDERLCTGIVDDYRFSLPDFSVLEVCNATVAKICFGDEAICRLVDLIIQCQEENGLHVDSFEMCDRSIYFRYALAMNFATHTIVYYQAEGEPNTMFLERWEGYEKIIVTDKKEAEKYAPYLDWEV